MLLIYVLLVFIPIWLPFSVSSMIFQYKINVLLCKGKCKSYGSCTAVHYRSEQLKCELIFGTDNIGTRMENAFRIFKQNISNAVCLQGEMSLYTRHGVLKCLKVPVTFSEELAKKRKADIGTVKVPSKVETGDSVIPYKVPNLPHDIMHATVTFPVQVKSGMKLSVTGAKFHGESFSQLSIIVDAKVATEAEMAGWLHTSVLWSMKTLSFVSGRSTTMRSYAGIISDSSNFTFVFVPTPTSTKIYANGVFVFSTKSKPWIEKIVIRRYSQVYQIVVQEAAEGEMKDSV